MIRGCVFFFLVYNKSVIWEHQNINKSVKECFSGTICIKRAIGVEKFTLSKASYFKRCTSGWKTWILKEFGKRYYENTAQGQMAFYHGGHPEWYAALEQQLGLRLG